MTEAGRSADDENPNPSLGNTADRDARARHLHASILAGVLPAPELLREYEEQHPGAAAWVLAQAEKSAEHKRAMQELALATGARDALLSRLLPFLIVLALIFASVLIAIFASAWLGGVTFAASLGAVMLDYLKRHSGR